MTDFESACLEVANAFLQTVVLLDDRAAFASLDGGKSDVGDMGAEAPLVEPDDPAAAPVPVAAVAREGAPIAREEGQGLDAGLITKGFAAKGLVCAVLRPHPGATLETETLLAAGRADIVVLDWEMADRGQKATAIVRHLHENDTASGGRLRLIAIYTGHSPLTNVYETLRDSLAGFGIPEGMKADRLTLESPGKTTRIVTLAKSAAPGATRERRFVVGEEELPERLVNEFAKFAGGLLPNATLAAIAALREHTHRMLARLDKSLDGPLITHNILVGEAGDPDGFIASVIMEELESQVPLTQIVRRYSGSESIAAYFQHKMERSRLKPRMPLETDIARSKDELTLDEVKGLVRSGLPGLDEKTRGIRAAMVPAAAAEHKKTLVQSLHKRLYLLTGEDEGQRRAQHDRFALITGMRRDVTTVVEAYAETHPALKLGAVLRCGKEYWVCITPICDCVRIDDAGGSFLLAELLVADGDWNVIIEADGHPVRLVAERKRQTIKSVVFGPATGGLVRPMFEAGKPVFPEVVPASNKVVAATNGAAPAPVEVVASTEEVAPATGGAVPGADRTIPDAGKADRYEWLGEMKPMQAQRIVQNFASNIARIGLDEFEWQRRHLPPG